MVPGTAAYAWLGHAGRAAIEGNTDALRYGALGLAALALVVLAPRLLRQFKRQSTAFVSVRDLQLLAREQRPLIVDVREPDEFKGPLGHIEGAINIPLGQLTTEWRKPDDRTYPLVAVCRTDTRSVKAADILRQSGIPNVKILRGGMEAWSKG
jgi:rhodanese-related sulfurtransferase